MDFGDLDFSVSSYTYLIITLYNNDLFMSLNNCYAPLFQKLNMGGGSGLDADALDKFDGEFQ